MIKKLNQRIFLLIMLSLSIIILGTIILFAFFSYNNTINTTTSMMDRFMGAEPKRTPNGKMEPEINVDGVYNIIIENSVIIQNSNTSKEINEYALKIAKKNTNKGIIGKYIYRTRKVNQNTIIVTLIENENAITHIQIIFLLSGIISLIAIIAIYIIAQKVSKTIVKPVEETFEKQKQFISDASHELKTPLAVIEANAEVLENESRY